MKSPAVLKSLMLIFCLIGPVAIHASGGDAHDDRGLNGQHSPDFPLNKYLAGQLGVINNQYRISYLVIAYRYLSNNPLSSKEQQALLKSYALFFSRPMEGDFRVDANKKNEDWIDGPEFRFTEDAESYGDGWWYSIKFLPINERIQSILNTYPKKIKAFTKYRLAAERFKGIAEQLTAAQISDDQRTAVLEQWLILQDQVFSKNFDPAKARQAFTGLPGDITRLLTLDTDYMEAASYFALNNEQSQRRAQELFTELAKNQEYPWHEWAEYMSARILNRMARPESDDYRRPVLNNNINMLEQAFQIMQSLALHAQDPEVKRAAKDYKGIIQSRFDRKGAIRAVVDTMTTKITHDNFYKLLYYIYSDGGEFIYSYNVDSTVVWNELAEEQSEILFWIFNYESTDTKKTFPIAYKKWQKAPDNAAWFLVALNNIKEATPEQQKTLLEAAHKIKPSHPGFFTFRSLLIKNLPLVIGEGKRARRELHQLIEHTLKQIKPGEDFSTRIHFYQTGIPLATSVENLLSYGFYVPPPAMLAFYPPVFDTEHPYYSPIEISEALNYLPLSVLLKVIQSKQLPTLPKRELYASVWARAMILGRYQIADRIAQKTGELNPELKKYISQSLRTKNPERRLKILVRGLLYFPELNPIIHFNNTWLPQWDNTFIYNGIKPRRIKYSHSNAYWCDGGSINKPTYSFEPISTFHKGPWNDLLTLAQKQQLAKEQAQLDALPNAAVWLLDKTNQMAKKYPKDIENAELLALAINLTRVMDCYSSDSEEAKRAFYRLHTFYGYTEAANRARYHY